MASSLELPMGIKPASNMLVRNVSDESVANAGVPEYSVVNWGLAPGYLVGVWGIGYGMPNLQVDDDQGMVGVTFNPDEDANTIQNFLLRDASVMWVHHRLDIVTSGGAQYERSKAPAVLLPMPLFTVRDSAVAFAQVSAAAAAMHCNIYYQVFEAEARTLVQLAGLSLSR